jgi:flagellar motor switch protein FliM
MVVRLAETTLTTADLISLRVGDVIMTEKPSNEALEIMVENRPMFSGFPGLFKGHKAIRISQQVMRPEDVVSAKLKSIGEKKA